MCVCGFLFVCLFVCFCNRRRCGNVFCLFAAIFACTPLNCSLFANDTFYPKCDKDIRCIIKAYESQSPVLSNRTVCASLSVGVILKIIQKRSTRIFSW